MQAVAVYNPTHRPRRMQANPVGMGAAVGIGLGVLAAAGLTAAAVHLIDRRSFLIPTGVTPSATKKHFFQVVIGQGGVALQGPNAMGAQAQIASVEPADVILSIPPGVGAQAEVGGDSVDLVSSTAQDFVFRWSPKGPGDVGEAALVLVSPPVQGVPMPLGTVVVKFQAT